jgi:transcription-repair coupling factor (superfamily II helicase)
MPVLIPEAYVQDLNVRLGLYRRLAELGNDQEIDAFAAEMIDRFGPLPVEAENLLQVVALKNLCKSSGVERLEIGPKGAVIAFKDNRFARPDKLVEFITKRPTLVTLRTDHRLVYRQDWAQEKSRMNGVKKLMQNLASMAA